MEQNDSNQNKNLGIFQSAQTYIILAIIVIAAIVFFSTRGNQNQNGENQNDQNQTDSTNQNGSGQPSTEQDSEDNSDIQGNTKGNVSAVGTLMASDNPQRGNLLLDSSSGKIYIRTARDFSSQLGQEVTLKAQGTLNQFVFLGFAESTVGPDVGGAPDEEPSGNVSFTGTLRPSDNSARGNYTINSGDVKVYLKTVHDYSALVDSTVTLRATGTLNSFTNATITK